MQFEEILGPQTFTAIPPKQSTYTNKWIDVYSQLAGGILKRMF